MGLNTLYSVKHPSLPVTFLSTSGGGVSYGTTDPVAAPSGDSGVYYNTDNGQLWVWNSASAAWDLLLG